MPAEPTWIGILLKDFDDSPVPNEDLVVTLDDGQVLSGKTDDKGHVRFDGVQPSRGQVAFVEIPDEAELRSDPASRLPDHQRRRTDSQLRPPTCGQEGGIERAGCA